MDFGYRFNGSILQNTSFRIFISQKIISLIFDYLSLRIFVVLDMSF